MSEKFFVGRVCREDKESVEGGCVRRVCRGVRRVCSCLQGLEFREREQPEILVL